MFPIHWNSWPSPIKASPFPIFSARPMKLNADRSPATAKRVRTALRHTWALSCLYSRYGG